MSIYAIMTMSGRVQLSRVKAKAQRCLKLGRYRLAEPHAKHRLGERQIIINDLFNVNQSQSVKVREEWNEDFSEWRYCFQTQKFEVVITFENPSRLVFITAWRLEHKGDKGL